VSFRHGAEADRERRDSRGENLHPSHAAQCILPPFQPEQEARA